MGLRSPLPKPRSPHLLRPTPRPRKRPPPSPPRPREPPSRHPPRLSTTPNPQQRTNRLGSPPTSHHHTSRLTNTHMGCLPPPCSLRSPRGRRMQEPKTTDQERVNRFCRSNHRFIVLHRARIEPGITPSRCQGRKCWSCGSPPVSLTNNHTPHTSTPARINQRPIL